MQGGGGSYIEISAESNACCREKDPLELRWNSAGEVSLTALLLYFIIILKQSVCNAPQRQQVQLK